MHHEGALQLPAICGKSCCLFCNILLLALFVYSCTAAWYRLLYCHQVSAAQVQLQQALGALLSQLCQLTGKQLRLFNIACCAPAMNSAAAAGCRVMHIWHNLLQWLAKQQQQQHGFWANAAAMRAQTAHGKGLPAGQMLASDLAQQLVLLLHQGPEVLSDLLQQPGGCSRSSSSCCTQDSTNSTGRRNSRSGNGSSNNSRCNSSCTSNSTCSMSTLFSC